MSNLSSAKHAPAEPAQLETKRSRRRAGGRAAALRRAPSDSDCSGETASLSADSAERAPRAPPQPARQTKSRGSRRRGSEWEVLEGLKDGQRFEKRPEVFNGYLHKKRKWPLKGWHKRFFVVDGGILVYARSPSDVARGRLHGSVDVGLSVISAKARRRRIDIDADEFIYHLRAKTPEVFRTWLNVLKAHRLYRQHLLTFGARESVPKIHAPLEDLPTDTPTHWLARKRTRTICSSSDGDRIDSVNSSIQSNLIPPKAIPSNTTLINKQTNNKELTSLKCIYSRKKNDSIDKRIVCCFKRVANSKELANNKNKEANRNHPNHGDSDDAKNNPEETLMHTTNLEVKSTYLESLMSIESLYLTKEKSNSSYRKTIPNFQISYKRNEENKRAKTSKDTNAVKNEPIVFCFTHKHRSCRTNAKAPLLKRSRKSTNMVKYRNVLAEPPLKQPLNRSMLLGKYKLKISRHSDARPARVILLNQNLNEPNENKKNIQKDEADTDFNKMTEKLVETVFENYAKFENYRSEDHLRSFINKVIAEIYCFSCEQIDDHPVKALFKCLLEYWIQNSSFPHLKETIKTVKSISKPSNYYFTKDKNTSSLCVQNQSKETQCHDYYDILRKKKSKHSIIFNPIGLIKVPKKESFNKEQKIQELERMIKNTVYYCDNTLTEPKDSKQDDIKITKILIENIGKGYPDQCTNKFNKIPNECELIELQKVINYLLSETSLPVDMAREIFKAYLNILKNDSIDDMASSLSVDTPKNIEPKSFHCDVLTDCVQKHISKNIMTQSFQGSFNEHLSVNNFSEIYLYNVLNKITFKTDNVKIPWDRDTQKEKIKEAMDEYRQFKNGSEFKIQTDKNEINKNRFLYLSQYNLEHNTTDNIPLVKEMMSISINLDDKTEISKPNYILQDNCKPNVPQPVLPIFDYKTNSDRFTTVNSTANYNINPYLDFNCNAYDNISIKPFCSSDTLSKTCFKKMYEKRWDINDIAYVVSDLNMTRLSSDKGKSNDLTLDENADNIPNTSKNTEEVDFKEDNICISGDKKDDLYSLKSKLSDIIDEEFKKLLLNKLSKLSETIPPLHEDIYKLYHKILQKYDKIDIKKSTEINNNDDNSKKDMAIQFEINPTNEGNIKNNATVNTTSFTTLLKENKFIDDKAENSQIMDKKLELENTKKTTELVNKNAEVKVTVLKEKRSKAVSNQKLYRLKCTRDFTMNTPFKFRKNEKNKRTNIIVTLKKKSPHRFDNRVLKNLRKNLINDNQKSKTSNPSNAHELKDKLSKDYKFYQQYFNSKYNMKKYSSMLTSNTKLVSNGDLKTLYRCSSDRYHKSGLVSPTGAPLRGPQAGFVSGTPGGRLATWIIDSGGPLENASRELGQAQLSVQQLQRLLDALEMQQQVHHDTDVSLEGASPNVKKDRRKFGLRKKKSNSKCASVELQPPHIDPSNSHMALSALTAPPSPGGGASSIPNSAASLPIACAATRPQSLPGAEALATTGGVSLASLTPDHQIREDFTVLAKDLVASLKGIVATLVCERGRLRAVAEAGEGAGGASLAALRSNLSTALHQNSVYNTELRSRLSRIHDASDLAEISSMGHNSEQTRQFQQSLSYSSSCVSASEFFDAEEHEDLKPEIIDADEGGVIELDGDSSSEAGSLSSEEGSASSDNSEAPMVTAEPVSLLNTNGGVCVRGAVGEGWSRRTRLPSPRPTPGGPSLWNLLYKNIGKDLSQISMPVTINEPLNMLQRLCEELEYSELLDLAANSESGVERMSLVAAFAVSAYAATAHRAASKPFNPLLAETYECVREDKGFRFVAEQVSHHPPISACHAESARWSFWQEARIRTKFWGKSMEFQPAGRVHVRLHTTGDHFTWNKVTTCVHNLFGGQRWVDQYGDMHIACTGTDITCKLNFVKASSWSSSRHEVRGAVSWSGGRLRLAGRWSETLTAGDPPKARCLWRPGAMPPEHEDYYGFTRFAMELNELEPGMKDVLPHTDTRLRPDQRALEEGDVDRAEQLKHQLEQAQRERRREAPDHTPAWFRKVTEGGEEVWVFTGEYWKEREAGFPGLRVPAIW
ncbi:PREDICTED: uncharacterized protein LOC106116396 isoform X2 [Papilio xuthus]|uniref:Oxysterol-binding protein n=1 Tax=Papilio xuthus TaxID=66420 RepID=A0AAJ7E763_PAPXU|nr:PREDICTED: uncharacterized protein LOC106116396 isoform X2 [Papilio xuthus]